MRGSTGKGIALAIGLGLYSILGNVEAGTKDDKAGRNSRAPVTMVKYHLTRLKNKLCEFYTPPVAKFSSVDVKVDMMPLGDHPLASAMSLEEICSSGEELDYTNGVAMEAVIRQKEGLKHYQRIIALDCDGSGELGVIPGHPYLRLNQSKVSNLFRDQYGKIKPYLDQMEEVPTISRGNK